MKHKLARWFSFEADDMSFKTRAFFSLFPILSLFIFFADRILTVEESFCQSYGFVDCGAFLYHVGELVCTVVIIVSILFGAYKISLLPILYFFLVDFSWVFLPNIEGRSIYYLLAFGIIVLIIFCHKVIMRIPALQDKRYKESEALHNAVLKSIEDVKKDL